MVGVYCRALSGHEEYVKSEAAVVLVFLVQGIQPWQVLLCPLQESLVFGVSPELFGRFQS